MPTATKSTDATKKKSSNTSTCTQAKTIKQTKKQIRVPVAPISAKKPKKETTVEQEKVQKKRGPKPKELKADPNKVKNEVPKEKRTGYFYEEQEQAVVDYNKATTFEEKDRIFREKLQYPFTKMIESIIRRYKLYTPGEDFQTMFDDTMAFLISKLGNFREDAGFKAYSYCGTVCKNHLILRINNYNKDLKKNCSYEDMIPKFDISNPMGMSYTPATEEESSEKKAKELGGMVIAEIKKALSPENIEYMTADEVKVGNALIELLENQEELFKDGSNKLNKAFVYYYLREATLLTTNKIREALKIYKIFYGNKKEEYKEF